MTQTKLPTNPNAWRHDGNTYRYWQQNPITKLDYCIWTRHDPIRGAWVSVFEDAEGVYHLGTGDSSASAFIDACERVRDSWILKS